MPISETAAVSAPAGAYAAALTAFREEHAIAGASVAAIYHAVRAMPYASGPDRTPLAALRSGRGACTAKHLVLRDLLRGEGVDAAVELVEGDFSSGLVPAADAMPPALAAMTREGGVRDIHCRVRVGAGPAARRLDATWPDLMGAFGVAVDAGWDGTGDTIGAIPEVRLCCETESVLSEKARLLAAFPPQETARRLRFLRLLSEWLE